MTTKTLLEPSSKVEDTRTCKSDLLSLTVGIIIGFLLTLLFFYISTPERFQWLTNAYNEDIYKPLAKHFLLQAAADPELRVVTKPCIQPTRAHRVKRDLDQPQKNFFFMNYSMYLKLCKEQKRKNRLSTVMGINRSTRPIDVHNNGNEDEYIYI